MNRKPLIHCISIEWWLFACLTILLLAGGCGRESLPLQPEGSAIPPSGSGDAASDSEEADPNKIIFFGTVVSVEDSSLVIEVSEPVPQDEGTEILWWEIKPGLDMNSRTTTVFIEPNTYIQMQEADLTSLKPDQKIMIAGTWLGNGIVAAVIVDLHMTERAIAESQLATTQAEGTLREVAPEDRPAFFDAMPETKMSGMPGRELLDSSATSDTRTLQFPGEHGAPAWAWDSGDLDIIIPNIPLLGWTEINNCAFLVGFGGGSYNFPFSFKADAPNPLIVDSTRCVDITVQPQPPPAGTFSFYSIFGCVFHYEVEICWFFGEICETFECNITMFTQGNATNDPAPMPGDTLRISDWACPGFDIEILTVEICTSKRILGEYFYTDGYMHDSLYMPLEPGWRYWDSRFFSEGFEGNPHSFSVWPATNPLNVVLRRFVYIPEFEIGFKGQVGLGWVTVYETPVLWIYKRTVSFIPPVNEECDDFYELETCGDDQPTKVTLTLPVVPVVTSLTSPDNIFRYGDLVTLNALVRGANGPGSSPKEVSFYDGDEFLATEPINSRDVASFQIPDPIRGDHGLNPCIHSIRAEYIGHDGQDNTYPTEKSLVLIVTGNADEVPTEDYWQDQYSGNSKTNSEQGNLECYLDIVNYKSTVFSEAQGISTVEEAYDVLSQVQGTAIDRLDRQLLVWWLNFANGSILYDQLIDYDLDGRPDLGWPFWKLMAAAEQVRLNPKATAKELEFWVQRLHDILITMQNGA